jgi:DNA polymerase-3 subunit gamma/tau
MLSSSAFNAFLKTLEEPPSHAIFILATTERHKILPTILSRCQVFTFNRIKVEDIANHLNYVANSEQIVAEAEALHVIAQKADGGLRDALSMFDQIVSYSGGNNVTYTQAIENLNVLDYDYYFRLIDFLWDGNYSEALLLFNDVLEKGFDGGNFIAGIAEHFRNLLVCQDSITLSLLEVSVGVKNKYQAQSQRCNPVQIIRALDLLSKTEQSLRGSKNQRLNIELALLQLSLIQTPIEEKKNPEPIVKPVEKAVEVIANAAQEPEKKTVLNFRGSVPLKTVSINQHIKKKEIPLVDEKETIETHSIVEDAPQQHFELHELKNVWKAYCDQMHKTGRMAMLGTLTLSEPMLNADYRISYEVHNDSQMRELELEKPELIGFLRKQLKNYTLEFIIEKSEASKSFKPYTSEEKLKAMEDRNPNVRFLRQKFGLQAD